MKFRGYNVNWMPKVLSTWKITNSIEKFWWRYLLLIVSTKPYCRGTMFKEISLGNIHKKCPPAKDIFCGSWFTQLQNLHLASVKYLFWNKICHFGASLNFSLVGNFLACKCWWCEDAVPGWFLFIITLTSCRLFAQYNLTLIKCCVHQ